MSLFDENTLRAEIVRIWGKHGAHIDVFDHMLNRCNSITPIALAEFDSPSDEPCQRSSSHDDRISGDGTYLVCINGSLHLGSFSEQWYGWSFNNWGSSGIQLDSIEAVWEVDLGELLKSI